MSATHKPSCMEYVPEPKQTATEALDDATDLCLEILGNRTFLPAQAERFKKACRTLGREKESR